jgi:hypothetical protein
MKKLVLLIMVLVASAFIGKVVIEKRYESKLDQAISLVRGFVDIRYQDIKVGFDGSIAINGLSITPMELDQSIDVVSIKAISSDRLFPVKGLDIFENGEFPKTFELRVQRLSAPIDLIAESQKAYLDSLPDDQECRSLATSFNYLDAGYSRIDSDIRMAFDFSDVYNATVNIDVFDQTSSLTLEWIFDANEVQGVFNQQSDQLPISEVNLSYELEAVAAERFVKQCAEVFSVTPEVYLQKVVGSAKYSENSFGADLGPNMRAALVKLMAGGSRLSVNSQPSLQLKKFQQLQFYQAKDILRWLNLSVYIDDDQVPLVTAALVADSDSEKKDKDQAEGEKKAKSKYFSASASSANSYIGRWVRIKRTDQRKPIEGKLTGIDEDNRLMVEMRRYTGLMTLTVGVEDIEAFQVLNK